MFWRRQLAPLLCVLCVFAAAGFAAEPTRLRLIVETDAGGDPDDEQSLVRFLLYANEWDVEGIIANRPRARDGENLNPVRDGLGIVRRQLAAYGEVQPKLVLHDKRYPTKDALDRVTVAGYDNVNDGVDLVIRAIDRDDPRPVWFLNWGTDKGSAESCLKRALDRVLAQRGAAGYATFKNRIRLSSDDQFGDHTWKIEPPFVFWAYPFRPDIDGGRWYHRFSRITKTAGGFDLQRDVLENHGPLGKLYPTNTNMPQKEGDSMTFLRLIPNGLNEPEHPEWGGWAGRFGLREEAARGQQYFCPNVRDTIDGKTNRDNTLIRWAAHLQNDFRARMDWCVRDYAAANHPPVVKLAGEATRHAKAGERIELDATASSDPDGNRLNFAWMPYPEASGYRGPAPAFSDSATARTTAAIPVEAAGQTIHLIAIVTDDGQPPQTRYARVIVEVEK
jgi:hypothetical protein